MKYLMLIAVDRPARPADRSAGERLMAEYQAFNEAITGSGELVAADRLEGAEAATCVRVRDGKTVVSSAASISSMSRTWTGHWRWPRRSPAPATGWSRSAPSRPAR